MDPYSLELYYVTVREPSLLICDVILRAKKKRMRLEDFYIH